MNFLAHLFLSGNNEPLIVGNFLGDFISNKEVAALPLPVQQGVWLHRQIDSFTDNHTVVRKSARRLRPVHGKYAPVILDVLHDFILAGNWKLYTEENLSVFAANIYAVLETNLPLMPPFLQQRLPLMIADDWLVRYGTEEGLRFTFSRMKLRSSYPVFFENAVESLKKDYSLYEQEFNAFFPEAVNFVKNLDLINDR